MTFSNEQWNQLLDLIERFDASQPDTRAALRETAQLQERLGLGRLELVWHREQIDGALTFHLLVMAQERVYSIGVSSGTVLPWPLRGATPAAPDVLVTVNGTEVRVWQAIACLDFLWQQRALMQAIVDAALIAEQSELDPPEVAAPELAAAVERFYSERGLQTVAQREQWQRERGMSPVTIEQLLRELLIRRKTEVKLVNGDLNIHRSKRRGEYQGIRVAQLALDEAHRERVSAWMEEIPDAGVFDLAARLAWDADYARPPRIEFLELLGYELGESAETVWSSKPGSVQMVQLPDGSWRLISLIAHESTVSETTLEHRIVKRLVNAWCAERRKTARIAWRWGPVA